MKKNVSILLLIVLGLVCSCSSVPPTTISPNVDFSKYTFATTGTIFTGSDSPTYGGWADVSSLVEETLESCGYSVISRTGRDALSDEERAKLLMVTWERKATTFTYLFIPIGREAECTITIADYTSRGILATYKGASRGFYSKKRPAQAIEKALKEMEKQLRKN